MSKRATIKDVAKKVGVSTATVTYVLNDKPKVSKEVRESIIETINELGYVPNRSAQALARKEMCIGIVFSEQPDEFFSYIKRGIENGLADYIDYKFSGIIKTYSNLDESGEVKRILEEMLESDINGLLFAPGFDYSVYSDTLSRFAEKGIPIMYLVSEMPEVKGIGCVRMNGRMAGKMAAQFLSFSLGSGTVVAIVTGNVRTQLHKECIDGFVEEAKRNNLVLEGIYETLDEKKKAYSQTEYLLGLPDLKGIYVSSYNSVSVCKCIEDFNKKDEVVVIGHDLYPELVDKMIAGSLQATLFQDLVDQGRKSVECLFRYLTEGNGPVGDVLITPNMVFTSNLEGYDY